MNPSLQEQFAAFVPHRLQHAFGGRGATTEHGLYGSSAAGVPADTHGSLASPLSTPRSYPLHATPVPVSSVHAPPTPPTWETQQQAPPAAQEGPWQSPLGIPQYNSVFQQQPWRFDTADLDSCVAPLQAIRAFARGVASAAQQQALAVSDAAQAQNEALISASDDRFYAQHKPLAAAAAPASPVPDRAPSSPTRGGVDATHGGVHSHNQPMVPSLNTVSPLSPVAAGCVLSATAPPSAVQEGGHVLLPCRSDALQRIRHSNALVDEWQACELLTLHQASHSRTVLAAYHSGVLSETQASQQLKDILQSCPVQVRSSAEQYVQEWGAHAYGGGASQALAARPLPSAEGPLYQLAPPPLQAAHTFNSTHPAGPLTLPRAPFSPQGQRQPHSPGASGTDLPQTHTRSHPGSTAGQASDEPSRASPQLLQQWLRQVRACLVHSQSPTGPSNDATSPSAAARQAKALEFKQAAWELARARYVGATLCPAALSTLFFVLCSRRFATATRELLTMPGMYASLLPHSGEGGDLHLVSPVSHAAPLPSVQSAAVSMEPLSEEAANAVVRTHLLPAYVLSSAPPVQQQSSTMTLKRASHVIASSYA